jgi:benzil reductase ((S)-benzoin forming)
MRHVVITGTSRGLGHALLAGLTADPQTRALALSRGFTDEQREHPRIITRACDLAVPDTLPGVDEIAAFWDGATEAVLLHNAAVIEPIGTVETLPAAQVARAVAVNLTATMVLTSAALAARPEPLRLRIVFISSGAAHHVISGWSVYSATKRAAEEFFTHVSAEWHDDPRVSAVCVDPGVIDTGMQATIRDADFAERQRFIDRHARGELRPPAAVAARILAEHLDSV